jgi:hypothetical protein
LKDIGSLTQKHKGLLSGWDWFGREFLESPAQELR